MADGFFCGAELKVIRSPRKSIAVQVRPESITVRAPLSMGEAELLRFLEEKRQRIEALMEKARERQSAEEALPKLSGEELRELAERARAHIPRRVAHYAPIIGVDYGRISIRNQRTRWGSCSGKGNLSFNCLLMLMPEEVIDSIVVHELCHRKYMNHSRDFYREIEGVYPPYESCRKWLKENGGAILGRMP